MGLPELSPRVHLIAHRTMQVLWLLLIVPTLLWWRESVLWVAFMSLYANFAAHSAAAEAAEAKMHEKDQD